VLSSFEANESSRGAKNKGLYQRLDYPAINNVRSSLQAQLPPQVMYNKIDLKQRQMEKVKSKPTRFSKVSHSLNARAGVTLPSLQKSIQTLPTT